MSVVVSESSLLRVVELETLVSQMRGQLTATNEQLAAITTERDNLRRAYRELMEQFELLRRRIFIAKAERVDASQLEIEFEATKKKLDALAQQLTGGESPAADATDICNHTSADSPSTSDSKENPGSRPAGNPPQKPKPKPKGRRNLADAEHLPERRIEIRDPELEKKGKFIGWEESYKLGHQPPEAVRVVIARAKYKTPVEEPEPSARSQCDGRRRYRARPGSERALYHSDGTDATAGSSSRSARSEHAGAHHRPEVPIRHALLPARSAIQCGWH